MRPILLLLCLWLLSLPTGALAQARSDAASSPTAQSAQDLRDRVIRLEAEAGAARDRETRVQAEIDRLRDAAKAVEDLARDSVKRDIDQQNLRIEDLGRSVDQLGVGVSAASWSVAAVALLLTIGGIALGFVGWRKIEDAVKEVEAVRQTTEKISKDAEDLLVRASLKVTKTEQEAAESLARTQKTEAEAKQIAENVRKQADKLAPSVDAQPSADVQPEIVAAAMGADQKPEVERTATDWLALAIRASKGGDYASASGYYAQILKLNDASLLDRARALNGRGISAAQMGQAYAASSLFSLAFDMLKDSQSQDDQAVAAKAAFNRAKAIGQGTDPDAADKAVDCYDAVIQRYRNYTSSALQEVVAMALINKGAKLGQGSGPDAAEKAIAAYDELIERYGDDTSPELQKLVTEAFIRREKARGRLT